MWSAYYQGLLFGLLLQLSVGPVCVGVFQKAVSERLHRALWMVLGVVVADGVYVLLAAVGMAAVVKTDPVRTIVGLVGALVLAYFGVRSVLTARPPDAVQASPGGAWISLRYGFILTLTNPLTIVFWGGVFATFLASGLYSGAALVAFGLGCVSATGLFLGAIATLGQSAAPLLAGGNRLVWLHRVVGVVLVVMAGLLALETIQPG